MTNEDFVAYARALFGTTWQTAFVEASGVSRRTVTRIVTGEATVSAQVERALGEVAERRLAEVTAVVMAVRTKVHRP